MYFSPLGTPALYVANCSFANNSVKDTGSARLANALFVDKGPVQVENCVFNDEQDGATPQIWLEYSPTVVVRTSCLPEATIYGSGNIDENPLFINPATGNLRLQSASPCIDQGNNYVDYQPTVPGFQLLPDTDLDGKWRVVDGDGDGDGTATVDMGAYEYQGQ